MAGQSPEPSFQPAGQDPNVTQGRPSWQAPGYSQPPASTSTGGGGQQAQAYVPPAYGAQDQGYGAQDQGYGAQDQTYTALGADQGQGYAPQGYMPPTYAGQGQGGHSGQATSTPPPQWHGIAGVTSSATQPRSRGEKGFVGSLFDFSFSSFVTPKIIKVLYILITIWTALVALIILIIGFKTGGIPGGLFTLLIVEPIFVLLTLGIYRVVLEAFMVVFRIYEETKKIRENSETKA